MIPAQQQPMPRDAGACRIDENASGTRKPLIAHAALAD